MKALVPATLSPSNLTNNIPITETAWTAGTYFLGDQRYIDGMWLYEVIKIGEEGTSSEPAPNNTDWKLVGAIDKYKMIDNRYSSSKEITGNTTVTINTSSIVTGIALLNLIGTSVNVTITLSDLTEVYNRTELLAEYNVISNYWSFFFSEVAQKTDIIFDDIPVYAGIVVNITITGGSSAIGELILGDFFDLGWTQFETTCSILDYSKKEVSDIGEVYLAQGRFAKKIDYSLQIERFKTSSVYNFLSKNRAKPLLWIGEIEREELTVFGFYRDFNIILSNPAIDLCSLNVEGL